MFFAISGFYMALILDTKYSADRRGAMLFWSNRLLRLMPTYWTILFATIVAFVCLVVFGDTPISSTFKLNLPWINTHDLGSVGSASLLFLIGVNLVVLGQDMTLFQRLGSSGNLRFTTAAQGGLPAYQFLVVPQAWSLSLELVFYAVAPWLLRRRIRTVALACAAGVGLRLILVQRGLTHDPWSYRFFPTMLPAFLAGSLVYKAGSRLRAHSLWRPAGLAGLFICAPLIVFNGSLGAALSHVVVHGLFAARSIAFGAVILFMYPVFDLTKRVRLDVFAGELSYPLYLVHLAVILGLGIPAQTHPAALGWLTHPGTPYMALLTLACAAALVFAVERPIDRYRQRRVSSYARNAAGEATPRAAEITM